MDKKYIELFREIAHNTEILSEKVRSADYEGKNENQEQVAYTMQKDYMNLYDKLRQPDFDDASITRSDFARLLVGTAIVINSLKNHIKDLTSAVNGYENNILPTLQRVFEESTTDEEAQQLAQKLFIISDTNN